MKNSSELEIYFNENIHENIIDILKNNKYKITPQRKTIVDILLKGESNTVKDIYFEASKIDKSIGIATVYRMVRILEELDIIKSNTININQTCINCQRQDTMIYVDEDNIMMSINMPKVTEHIKRELKKMKLIDNEKILITVKKSCTGIKKCNEECDS